MSNITRDEILTMLLFGLSAAMRPTMDNLFNGDRYWQDYGTHHRGQLSAMESAGLIESQGKRGQNGWALKLTDAGKLRAIGGREAESCWGRSWDGQWQLLMFDLEGDSGKLRQKLFRWLRSNRFGCLQQSAWITPDPIGDELEKILTGFGDKADSILTLRSQIISGKKKENLPAAIASRAWDFDKINQRYRDYIDFAKSTLPKRPTPIGARRWVSAERQAWRSAFDSDPLLPDAALPRDYLGKRAVETRERLLKSATPMIIALGKPDPNSPDR